MAQTNNQNNNHRGSGNRQGGGDRRRDPRSNSGTRAAGRAAVGPNNPDGAQVQTPEEQRAGLRQAIGRAVMSQVMDRVKVSLGETSKIADPAKARQDIDKLITDYTAASGGMTDVLDTYKLLDLDDDGIKKITEFMANATKGLDTDAGKEFFTEAQDSTNKIIDDLTQTGRARIVGPDGKLYDMELIAVDQDDRLDAMSDCLSTEMNSRIAANQPFSIAGTYGVSGDANLLPNMLHGEIIAEDKLPNIKTALDRESARTYDHKDGATYGFVRIETDDPRFAQLLATASPHSEFIQSVAGAYYIDYAGVGFNILPTTAWYASHGTTQWEFRKSQSASVTPPTPPKAPAGDKQPAIKVTSAGSPTTTAAPSPAPKPKPGPPPSSPKPSEQTPTKPERKEILKSVVDYFVKGISGDALRNGGDELKAALAERRDLLFGRVGQDCYGKLGDPESRSALFVLSDGMGSPTYGDEASRLTAEAFIVYGLTDLAVSEPIAEAVKNMSERIMAARRKVNEFNGEHGNAGATVVAAEVIGDKLVYGSVGDSSLFVVRNGQFILVAGDRGGHSHFITNSIGAGVAARPNPMPQYLLSGTSIDEQSRLERAGNNPAAVDKIAEYRDHDAIGVFQLQDGDRVVLCSDGVMGDWTTIQSIAGYYRPEAREIAKGESEQTLTDAEIVAAVETGTTEQATQRLIDIAKKTDDRTVQMFDIKLQ
ncbi:MAG: PP2C family protein-serine/threonine phosphatase [Sphaerimonospora mesophila]